jgi:putative transposase
MPDHLHAILSFGQGEAMPSVISDWKRFHKCQHKVAWQENFFDHRLRDDERGEQLLAKLDYIRNNPVVAGLCARPEDWPWKIDPFVEAKRGQK